MTRRSRSRKQSATRRPGLIAVVVIVLLAGWFWQQQRTHSPATAPQTTSSSNPDTGTQSRPLPLPGLGSEKRSAASEGALPAYLPPEARETLGLIASGGPFPNGQDGAVFGNREGRLPAKPRGYYQEYTVTTPGLGHRGARRIVTGGQPPEVYYYSDDHYESFRSFTVPR